MKLHFRQQMEGALFKLLSLFFPLAYYCLNVAIINQSGQCFVSEQTQSCYSWLWGQRTPARSHRQVEKVASLGQSVIINLPESYPLARFIHFVSVSSEISVDFFSLWTWLNVVHLASRWRAVGTFEFTKLSVHVPFNLICHIFPFPYFFINVHTAAEMNFLLAVVVVTFICNNRLSQVIAWQFLSGFFKIKLYIRNIKQEMVKRIKVVFFRFLLNSF